MTTFYVLPTRVEIASRFASFLNGCCPGAIGSTDGLTDLVTQAVESTGAAVVIYSDEIPDGISANNYLSDVYGAEPGDRIIDRREVTLPSERQFSPAVRVREKFASTPARHS